MNEYDISLMFDRIELELIKKIKKRLEKGIPKESVTGMTPEDWNIWQIESLKSLRGFRKEHSQWFNKECQRVNEEIKKILMEQYLYGLSNEETAILNMIKSGVEIPNPTPVDIAFFNVPTRNMKSLLEEIIGKFENVEYSILRQTEDVYRKIIQNSQLYLVSGAGTTWDCVDMATADFTKNGIFCVEYKDGKQINISSYSEMAIRTGGTRASNIGRAEIRKEHGLHLVQVSAYGMCSPTCLPWQGRCYCDDVNNIPTQEELEKYTKLSTAIEGGLFHPNCRHGLSVYIPEISPKKTHIDKSDKEITEDYKNEQHQRYNERQIRKWKKQEEMAMDEKRKIQCKGKVKEWQKKNASFCKEYNLRRDYEREKVRY